MRISRNIEFQPKEREMQILSLIAAYKESGLYRKGNFSTEIVWGKRNFMFPVKKKDDLGMKKGMFLFSMVRRDALNLLKGGKEVKVPTKYPVNETNHKFDKLGYRITATDLNHAYWRIAFNLGIINKKTYEMGLSDELKVVRLAALSTLGASKNYAVIRDGEITEEIVKLGGNEELQNLYKAIRYNCYRMMQDLKRLLKNDFISYKTDCIYYLDTPDNRKMVREYCKANKMTYKQLTGDTNALYTEGIYAFLSPKQIKLTNQIYKKNKSKNEYLSK